MHCYIFIISVPSAICKQYLFGKYILLCFIVIYSVVFIFVIKQNNFGSSNLASIDNKL